MYQIKSPTFTLYEHKTSPFCVSIRIALNECGAILSSKEINLNKIDSYSFLKKSPFGRVPILIEHQSQNELIIFESSSILIFLSDRFPQSSLGFSNINSKIKAISWLNALSSGLIEYIWVALNENAKKNKKKQSEVTNTIKLKKYLDILNKHLNKNSYLTNKYSIADTFATPIIDLLETIHEIDVQNYKNILKWRERLRNRPSYKNCWSNN